MAITCLDNFIGLRGTCADTEPVSGLYVNDFPGVDLRMISGLSNEEQQDFQGVWDEIYRRSVAEVVASVKVRMQKYFKKTNLIENRQVGYYTSPAETEAASAHYKGVAISFYGSNYTQIFINEAGLYLNAGGSVTVKIFDYRTGVELDSLTFTGVTGHNVFQVNKSYDVFGQKGQLFVGYNATAVSSNVTNTYHPEDISYDYSLVRGAKVSTASSVLEANMLFEGNTYGLTVNYNVQCSVERFICSVRDILAPALNYKLAEQLFLERIMSTRLNKYTLFNQERAKELRDEYVVKYTQLLDSILNELEPAGDGLCIECDKERTYKYQLP